MEHLSEDRVALSTDPTECNMCGLCAVICPAQAITVDWTIPNDASAKRILLIQGRRIYCSECGQEFWGDIDVTKLCPRCTKGHDKPKMIWPEFTIERNGGAVIEL